MNGFASFIRGSPIRARVLPYVVILLLTFAQDSFANSWRFWIYLAKMIVGFWCIRQMRRVAPEVRWALSWEAISVGIIVFIIWVGLDPYYPKLQSLSKASAPWNPFKQFGENSLGGWFFSFVRVFGSAWIVPPIEEAFYRSFLYRYLGSAKFEDHPLGLINWRSLIVTSLIFGFSHYQWLAGILCGLAYQALVIRKNRLGDAMAAHAITNLLLGSWIIWKAAWQFW
jgi:CAAX prenyl protease-like protein